MSNYTDEEFELDCIDALNATYFLPSSEQATRRIIADRNRLKALYNEQQTYYDIRSENARLMGERDELKAQLAAYKAASDHHQEQVDLLRSERDALRAEIERQDARTAAWENERSALHTRLAAAENVCAAVKHQHYEDATHVAPTEAEVMVATALAEWEALRKEFTND